MRELKISKSARPKSPTQKMLPRQEEFKFFLRILRISRFKFSSLKKEANFCTLFFIFYLSTLFSCSPGIVLVNGIPRLANPELVERKVRSASLVIRFTL